MEEATSTLGNCEAAESSALRAMHWLYVAEFVPSVVNFSGNTGYRGGKCEHSIFICGLGGFPSVGIADVSHGLRPSLVLKCSSTVQSLSLACS